MGGRQMHPPNLFRVKGVFIAISNEANVRFTMNGAFLYLYLINDLDEIIFILLDKCFI